MFENIIFKQYRPSAECCHALFSLNTQNNIFEHYESKVIFIHFIAMQCLSNQSTKPSSNISPIARIQCSDPRPAEPFSHTRHAGSQIHPNLLCDRSIDVQNSFYWHTARRPISHSHTSPSPVGSRRRLSRRPLSSSRLISVQYPCCSSRVISVWPDAAAALSRLGRLLSPRWPSSGAGYRQAATSSLHPFTLRHHT